MPEAPELPIDLRKFIARNIASLDQFAILLAMHADPVRWWTRELTAELVGLSPHDCEPMLLDLVGSGLAVVRQNNRHKLFRFAPQDPRSAQLVARLSQANREQQLIVAQQLGKQAIERIRREARRTFSGALTDDGKANSG